MHYRHLRT